MTPECSGRNGCFTAYHALKLLCTKITLFLPQNKLIMTQKYTPRYPKEFKQMLKQNGAGVLPADTHTSQKLNTALSQVTGQPSGR